MRLVVCVLLATAFALVAAEETRPGGHYSDHALGCEVAEADTKPWLAKGFPGGVTAEFRSQFRFLGSWTREKGADPSVHRFCSKTRNISQKSFLAGYDMGGITRGDVVIVHADTKVYRAWTADSKPYVCSIRRPSGEWGAWWSLTPIGNAGSQDRYRRDNAVCPGWNLLNMRTVCTLKSGTAIIIGATERTQCYPDKAPDVPGRPPACHDGTPLSEAPREFTVTYPKTNTLQLYIHIDRDASRKPVGFEKYLTNCQSSPYPGGPTYTRAKPHAAAPTPSTPLAQPKNPRRLKMKKPAADGAPAGHH